MRKDVAKKVAVANAVRVFLATTEGVHPHHVQGLMHALEEIMGYRIERVDLPVGKVWLLGGNPVLYWDGYNWFLPKPYSGWEEFIPVEA